MLRYLRAGLCPANMLRFGVNTLVNDEAGDGAPEFSTLGEYRLIPMEAGDMIKLAGLGAGEPCSEIVQALTAEGVACLH
jgi:hypothetical protein